MARTISQVRTLSEYTYSLRKRQSASEFAYLAGIALVFGVLILFGVITH